MNAVLKGWLSVLVLGCVAASSAQTVFPLRLDIDVSTKRNRRNIGAGWDGEAKVEQVQVRVKIRKPMGQPYNDPLTAELYVIGRQIHTGYYGIIDVDKRPFTISKENDNSFEFNSRTYSIGRTKGNINVGGTYETFLVVVVDKDGEIIETRSGRVIREKGVSIIRQWDRGTLFDRDGNVLGHVDENDKNKAFKQAVPAAVNSSR